MYHSLRQCTVSVFESAPHIGECRLVQRASNLLVDAQPLILLWDIALVMRQADAKVELCRDWSRFSSPFSFETALPA